MIRKQLYLAGEQQTKLRRLARRWGCTEAQVVRTAIDRLPEPAASDRRSDLEEFVAERLAAAGLLVPPEPDDDLPTPEEAEELEKEYEKWLDEQSEPLGLAEAVLEDRR